MDVVVLVELGPTEGPSTIDRDLLSDMDNGSFLVFFRIAIILVIVIAAGVADVAVTERADFQICDGVVHLNGGRDNQAGGLVGQSG